MKTLRFKVLLASVITILAFITVLQTACKKDTVEPYVDTACQNVDCNNGDCINGQCGCHLGWEGYLCDIKAVDKFMGKWNAIEEIKLSNVPANIGDTMMYDFYITADGSSVNTIKLSGLNGKPNDTIICTLGDLVDHYYDPLSFYFLSYASTSVQGDYITTGGGVVSSSGSQMDTMRYGHWYGVPGDSTFVVKDSVSVYAQKAP